MNTTGAGVALANFPPPQRTPARTAGSIALHALAAAVMYVSPLIVFVPAAYISSGLKNGRRGAIAALAGSMLLLVGGAALGSTPRVFQAQLAEISGLMLAIGLPSVVATWLMRRGAEFGQVMFAVLLTSLGGMMATELVMRSTAGISPYRVMAETFQSQSSATAEFYQQLGVTGEKLAEMRRFSEALAGSYLVLFLEIIVITIFTFSLIMIPRLPVGRITGSTYLLRNLAWPDGLLFGFVAGGLAPFASGNIRVVGLNLLGIVVFCYLLQGLAVFRYTVLRLGTGLFGTFIGIVLLVFFFPVAGTMLFLVGLFDPFFDFRKLKRKDHSDESHSD